MPASRGAYRHGGFTLIEVVVVIAVLAVATAVVLPGIGRGGDTLRLHTEAGRVVTLLRHARQLAVSRHRPTHVALDRARNTVTLTVGQADTPVRELSMPAGLRLDVASGRDALTFSPRGRTTEATWVVELASGRRLAIRVEPLTGRVRVGADRES